MITRWHFVYKNAYVRYTVLNPCADILILCSQGHHSKLVKNTMYTNTGQQRQLMVGYLIKTFRHKLLHLRFPHSLWHWLEKDKQEEKTGPVGEGVGRGRVWRGVWR